MNRRKFLSGSLVAGAAAAASGLRRGKAGLDFVGEANAAEGLTPYPVMVIGLHGGLDPAMHLVAQPNGSFGNIVLENRMSGTTGIKTTAKGIRYFTGSVAAAGKADFEQHLSDVALLRAFAGGAISHSGVAKVWYGDYQEAYGQTIPGTPSKTPWAHYLASKFRAAGAFVPKPCIASYPNQDISVIPFLDLAAYGNLSPDPSVVVERVLSYDSFFDSLSNAGLPDFARQTPAYALSRAIDGRTYAANGQPDIRTKFGSANVNADNVMKSVYGGAAWPPPQSVLDSLGVPTGALSTRLTSKTDFRPFFAFAYQALSKNLSHVLSFSHFEANSSGVRWDSHALNYQWQMICGQALWSALGKMVSLMKATPSPIVPGKSLFDTTNIWVQSEMGRSPLHQESQANPGEYDTGTNHWAHGSALFMGGRFKRGIAIGGFDPRYRSIPLDLVTGQPGSQSINFNNLVATVIKAAGADPSGFTNQAPIDALLDMSL